MINLPLSSNVIVVVHQYFRYHLLIICTNLISMRQYYRCYHNMITYCSHQILKTYVVISLYHVILIVTFCRVFKYVVDKVYLPIRHESNSYLSSYFQTCTHVLNHTFYVCQNMFCRSCCHVTMICFSVMSIMLVW